jgi:hypothetical protein
MALTLAAREAGEDEARALQLVIEYDPQPPYDAGSLEKAEPGTRQTCSHEAWHKSRPTGAGLPYLPGWA